MDTEPKHETPRHAPLNDAVPDPEPAVPSLPGPDPGVFHHDPAPLEPGQAKPAPDKAP